MIASFLDLLCYFGLSFLCVYLTIYFATRPIVKTEDPQESQKERLKRRLAMLSTQHDELLETAGLSDEISTFAKNNQIDFGADLDAATDIPGRIRRIMKKAGITDMSMTNFVILCSIGGVVMVGIVLYFNFLNALTGIPIGFCVGAYLMFNFLRSRAEKRKQEFLQLFPDAIDMMIRGVKAGLNINRIMKLVAMESREPVSTEYEIISQKLDLGIEPEKVFLDAANRIDIEEFRFLVVALVLQMENGGMLGEILANLSGIVRKRLELELKMKAMCAEARMSAIVLSALPFGFAGIMALLMPNHLQVFTQPGTGQTLLKVMIVLFALGFFFMIRATKIKV